MDRIPVLGRLRALVSAPVRSAVEPADGTPVELEARELVEQLVPEVYRPLSVALGTTTTPG